MSGEVREAAYALVQLSEWIDAGNTHRDREAVLWGRVAKLTEESGEAIAALIGATGQNPRKGVTHSLEDVVQELLDVAVTALGAIEHINDHDGQSLSLLVDDGASYLDLALTIAAALAAERAKARAPFLALADRWEQAAQRMTLLDARKVTAAASDIRRAAEETA